jgi:hypothetical protein
LTFREEDRAADNSDVRTATERSRQTNASKEPDCFRGFYRRAFLSLPPAPKPLY